MTTTLKWATSLLPPALRRAASGAYLDLKGLPGRVRDPARWREPWQAIHNVGGGDFERAGQQNLGFLVDHAGLTPAMRVLDIGCGTGRMAAPLLDYLARGAGYVGFDVSRAAVAACRRRFGTRRDDFRFVHVDVRNHEYRSGGAIEETALAFPAADGEIDVAMATSVFSHMRLESIRHYLAETYRVLKPGGRFMFTAFALTPDRVTAIQAGQAALAFQPWEGGAMVVDPRSPERAIAHPQEALEAAVREAGFDLPKGVIYGGWLPPTHYAGGQDLFVAVKP
jgi:ubiquinone/menaquinone biosynthesis C-methylase UbiE